MIRLPHWVSALACGLTISVGHPLKIMHPLDRIASIAN